MKAAILIIMLVIAALVVQQGFKGGPKHGSSRAVEGLNAPDFTLKDDKGNTLTLKSIQGKAVLLNFWATWCTACVEEIPSLQRLYAEQKGNPDLQIITVLFRDSMKNATAFMKDGKYDFPVLQDPDHKSAKAYGLTGVPETFLIDNRGIVAKRILGPVEWDSKTAKDMISKLTGK
ncbi:MAG: redoxin domain-containing protein [Nitrospirae bacterium]|uniref:TlpA family protein disulfide reductase n=1 Tax=Candidatus Magnetobacterium casense TaxID=1455061 RepID=UPI00058D458F|nr:TlpA disulfide reductase family protein [Candidatus Magnetobacterium casensis]MBF0338831.1 redoxin domain-containing protein [Nitrospirota bacterium]